MAPKDYVGRKGGQKKAPPHKPPLPWVRIVITLALVLGFVFFLLQVKDKASEKRETTQDPAQVEVDQLPELSEEEWEFIESLPSYEVQVDDVAEVDSDKRYVMQCGSFRTEAQAEAMKARIAFQGLEAQMRATEGKNGLWYRVYLGPYESKRKAERDRHAIRKADITTCRIWLWNL